VRFRPFSGLKEHVHAVRQIVGARVGNTDAEITSMPATELVDPSRG